MAFTTDVSTLIGKVRLYIQDQTEATALFTDDEIQVFLTAEGDDVLCAAARALDTVAASTALTAKMIKIGNYASDTRNAAKELREQADTYRAMAATSATVEMALTDYNAVEIARNKALRGL